MDTTYIDQNKDNFLYLFRLQASGRTNMFGAGAFLEAEMGLDRLQAKAILAYWMNNYEEIAKHLNVEV